MDDEHFFGSYEAERMNAEGQLTLEFDSVEARRPTTEQFAHRKRFRRPVAWVMLALGSLSLVALARHGLQNSDREVVAQVGSVTSIRSAAAVGTAERTSEEAWFWTGLAESAIALVLEPTPPRTSDRPLSTLADSATSAMQASLVNDFTSELLSMCREVSS